MSIFERLRKRRKINTSDDQNHYKHSNHRTHELTHRQTQSARLVRSGRLYRRASAKVRGPTRQRHISRPKPHTDGCACLRFPNGFEYARRHGHTAPVVHGLQVFAFTAPGATLFPQYIGDVFLTFTSASCRFLKEVHAGDTLYPQLEITKLRTQGDTGIVTTRATVHNQRGELVLEGEHTYSLKAASANETVASPLTSRIL